MREVLDYVLPFTFPEVVLFRSAAVVVQRWNDFRLTWNESEIEGFLWTYVAPSKIWTPDLYLQNKYVVKNCHKEFDCFTALRFIHFSFFAVVSP